MRERERDREREREREKKNTKRERGKKKIPAITSRGLSARTAAVPERRGW